MGRQREQFDHEGLVGSILDMDMTEYANYKEMLLYREILMLTE